ncbi:transglutaminase domain-containing protein [Candidatus Fermentibacteria bacterium]|nr:transglutaminase domain-containing protein [Candidatus Fermentibacteria bacterium]
MPLFAALFPLLVLTAPHVGEQMIDLLRVPDAYSEGVAESWRLAGRNGGELEEFLAAVEDSLMEEASFLVANLPYRDLGVIDAATLREDLRWAALARDSLHWGREVPGELFLHYVLPHRVSQERIQAWRPFFFDELFPVVKNCSTMTEAALAVNRWLDDRIGFVVTEARDQGPVTTVRRGIGRCEEMTIAFIAAARAVCLPARQCWTPWWRMTDNNHAWAEVWVDGAWHYLGAGEFAPRLDQAWFSEPAKDAAAVYSLCYGRWSGDDVYKATDRYSLINSTAVYAAPCTVAVHPPDNDSWTAAVSVFNFGAFRPVAELTTKGHGPTRFVVGPGTYLVTVGDDSTGFWRLVRAGIESVAVVEGTPAKPSAPSGFLWLRGRP